MFEQLFERPLALHVIMHGPLFKERLPSSPDSPIEACRVTSFGPVPKNCSCSSSRSPSSRRPKRIITRDEIKRKSGDRRIRFACHSMAPLPSSLGGTSDSCQSLRGEDQSLR